MDKPEDYKSAPRQIREEATLLINSFGHDLSLLEGAIAAAILSAQSQAYIDAARIAEKDGETELSWANMELPISPGPVIAKDRARVASRISAAILQRKEEMK